MPAIGNKDSSDRAETKSLLVEMAGYSTVVFLDSWVVWTFALRLGFSQWVGDLDFNFDLLCHHLGFSKRDIFTAIKFFMQISDLKRITLKKKCSVPLRLSEPTSSQMNAKSHNQDRLACSRNIWSHKLEQAFKRRVAEIWGGWMGALWSVSSFWETQF